MTNETELFPSEYALDAFIVWLKFVLKDKDGNIEKWANHLIMNHDWSASNRIEVSGRQTLSGNPEFFTF
jgi:hypothetical protein